MNGRKCCESACYNHAQQRSLYRHAVNALRLASQSGCDSEMAREVAERCAELLRAADREEHSAAASR